MKTNLTLYESDLQLLTYAARDIFGISTFASRTADFFRQHDSHQGKVDLFNRILERAGNYDSAMSMLANATFPTKAASLASQIWDSLQKAIQCQDEYLGIESQAGAKLDISANYRDIVGRFFEHYKYNPGGVAVVDGNNGEGGKRRAHVVFVPARDIFKLKRRGASVHYVKYRGHDGKIFEYHAENGWRVGNEKNDAAPWQPKYWGDAFPVVPLSTAYSSVDETGVNVMHPILGELESYLFSTLMAGTTRGYAHAQIIQQMSLAMGCGFDNGAMRCEGGRLYLTNTSTTNARQPYVGHNGQHMRCPVCNPLPAFGSVQNVMFHERTDRATMPEKVKFVAPDVNALKFSDESLTNEMRDIYRRATGRDYSSESNSALKARTVDEINSQLAEHTAKLLIIKSHIEPSLGQLFRALAEYEHGKVNVVFSLGENYQILGESDAFTLYTEAEKVAPGTAQILKRDLQLATTTYPNDPTRRDEMIILLRLQRLYGVDYEKYLYLWRDVSKKTICDLLDTQDLETVFFEINKFYNEQRRSKENGTGGVSQGQSG